MQNTARIELPAQSLLWRTAWALAQRCANGLHRCWLIPHATRWQLARQRSRRALMQLDDRLLRDIGISRSEALREAEKPFWMS